jgi:hypothetical protein
MALAGYLDSEAIISGRSKTLLIAALRQASRFRNRTLREREKYRDYHTDIQLRLDTDSNRMSYKSKIKI